MKCGPENKRGPHDRDLNYGLTHIHTVFCTVLKNRIFLSVNRITQICPHSDCHIFTSKMAGRIDACACSACCAKRSKSDNIELLGFGVQSQESNIA